MGRPPDSMRVVDQKVLLGILEVARQTWQHWCSKGLVEDSESGRYGESHVVRGVVARLLNAALGLADARVVLDRAHAAIEEACLALDLNSASDCDLVIDHRTLECCIASRPADLHRLVHRTVPSPRSFVVVPVTRAVVEARQVFWTRAVPPSELAGDRRRRASKSGDRRRRA